MSIFFQINFKVDFVKYLFHHPKESSGNFHVIVLLCKLTPYIEHRERSKKDIDHSRLVGDRFNKQENLCDLFWQLQDEWISIPASQILEVMYTEAFTEFNNVFSPDSLNSILLFQGYVFENGSHCGNGTQSIYSKDRGTSYYLDPACGSTDGHALSMTSNTPSFITGSYNLTQAPLPWCALGN